MSSQTLKAAALLPLVLLLCQCDQVRKASGSKAPDVTSPDVTTYDYSLKLSLSPNAAAQMKASNNHFLIDAYYYGHAKPEDRARADKLNRLDVGYQQLAFDADARSVQVHNNAIDAKALANVVGNEPFVIITVRSADKADFPTDIIECKTFTGPIKRLQTQPQTLSCDVAKGTSAGRKWRPLGGLFDLGVFQFDRRGATEDRHRNA